MSKIKKAAFYGIRGIQVIGVLLALYLILAPLLGDANFFEGLAWTVIGLVSLVFVVVLELISRWIQ